MAGRFSARALTLLAASTLAVSLGGAAAASAGANLLGAAVTAKQSQPPQPSSCALGPTGSIQHVIYIQFDNTHYRRDDPNVPSDLQQMPNLLTFITGHGTLISHEHTPLIAHTADDIVTSETGLYGSRQGIPIANEYNYYKPDGTSDTAGSFAYWTDPIVDYDTNLAGTAVGDHTHTMITQNGKNAPAPWVPYTRAGCNFGTVAAANTELENTLPDVALVYGKNSPEAKEAGKTNSSGSDQAQAEADFMGLAVHCARGSAVCSRSHRAVPDVLPDEPGGYHGFRALYGNRVLQPVISPSGPVRSLGGSVIKNSYGQIGFPGYDGMTGPNGLAYTLDMQLHGVPVTYTYLSDLHDSWTTGSPFGPGQAGYEHQLKVENAAFGTFFARLAANGITKANTLFVFTADEGDHFVGSKPSPAGCNGVKVICHYSRIGEVNGNLTGLLAAKGITTAFDVNADSAPVIYVRGQPGRETTAVRALERAAGKLTGDDLATGKTVHLTNYLADPVELRILHMVTADPKRTPTVVLFGNTDFWLYGGATSCGTSCFSEPKGTDAWNHGTVGSQINTTWLGMVGPGVAHLGVDNSVWSDHTNIQPTTLALLRLHDDYAPDGRVLGEIISPSARPAGMRAHRGELLKLGQVYTQINAPVGSFGMDTLAASTRALESGLASTYSSIEKQLAKLGQQRDTIAAKMRRLLLGAAFGGKSLGVGQAAALIKQGYLLLGKAAALAA
ncbi:MAG: hypothetical protein ACLQFR_30895 [Streptosporangiaceae bacterium]